MLPLSSSFLLLGALAAPGAQENPVELGAVRWQRDLEQALARARDEGKPVFALFQEIPGCATCQRFGQGPLSHPLLVEAIEDLFVPLAIQNNRPGRDAQALERYGEPAWNNPVVRFLGADGADLIPRRDRVWTTGGIASRAAAALEASGAAVPPWLAVVVTESGSESLSTATFGMHCFWEGEARLGSLDGVVATRAGWLEGHEVVDVRYDPRRIDYASLVREANAARCATRVYARGDDELATARRQVGERAVRIEEAVRLARPSDQKRQIGRSPLRLLALTPMQRTKVNAALGTGADPARWLSPRQRATLERVTAVLAKTPDRLAGLQPPETVLGLLDYERELAARLAD